MTIVKHELKQGKMSLIIWTAAIGFLMSICVFIFPDMKGEMEGVSDIFSSMGSFTEAFGMDRLNFGTLLGFYTVECGNILGLGGAFFAALCGISVLAKEEKEHTAELLFTHPISRFRVLAEKLAAVLIQVIAMNLFVLVIAVLSVAAIGEELPLREILLMHLAYTILQIEIAFLCFGVSAFIRNGSLGIGLGLAAVMYFLNIIANIADTAEFLKYITPFGYTEGADIVENGSLDILLVCLGIAYGIIAVVIGFRHYTRKDLR